MVKELDVVDFRGFKEETNEGLVLVQVHATWCGPCKMMGQVLESYDLDKDSIPVFKFDIDKSREVVNKLDVTSVPVLIVYKDGVELDRKSGYMDRAELVKWIEELKKK